MRWFALMSVLAGLGCKMQNPAFVDDETESLGEEGEGESTGRGTDDESTSGEDSSGESEASTSKGTSDATATTDETSDSTTHDATDATTATTDATSDTSADATGTTDDVTSSSETTGEEESSGEDSSGESDTTGGVTCPDFTDPDLFSAHVYKNDVEIQDALVDVFGRVAYADDSTVRTLTVVQCDTPSCEECDGDVFDVQVIPPNDRPAFLPETIPECVHVVLKRQPDHLVRSLGIWSKEEEDPVPWFVVNAFGVEPDLGIETFDVRPQIVEPCDCEQSCCDLEPGMYQLEFEDFGFVGGPALVEAQTATASYEGLEFDIANLTSHVHPECGTPPSISWVVKRNE